MTSPESVYTRVPRHDCRFQSRHKPVQPDDQTYRLIPLAGGRETKVSTHRYEFLSQWAWSFSYRYAVRGARSGKHTLGIRMHRVIMGLGPDDPLFVDHINGDGLDNRDENLRIVTHSENMRNKKANVITKSGVKGIYAKNGRYQAYICLGTFDTLEEAKEIRDHYGKIVHGEFYRGE